MGRGSLRLGLSPKESFLVLPYITCNISDFDILSRVYLLPFIGSKWFSEFSETYLCLRGKGKPSFILLRSANKEKSIQILQYCNGENKNCSSDKTEKTEMKQNSKSE